MTKSIGAELSTELHGFLSAPPAEDRIGKIVLMITVDNQGFPHLTALSLGEVVACGRGELRLLVFDGGRAVTNVEQRSELTVAVVDYGICSYIKGRATVSKWVVPPSELQPFIARRLDVEIVDVLMDSEVGASVEAAARYRRDVPHAEELKHWRELRTVLVR